MTLLVWVFWATLTVQAYPGATVDDTKAWSFPTYKTCVEQQQRVAHDLKQTGVTFKVSPCVAQFAR